MEKDREDFYSEVKVAKMRMERNGYKVSILTNWSIMAVSESALLQSDPKRLDEAIRRHFRART